MININNKTVIAQIMVSLIISVLQFFSFYKLLNESLGLFIIFIAPILLALNMLFLKHLSLEFKSESRKVLLILRLVFMFLFGTFLIKSFIIYIYPIARMVIPIALLYGLGWSLFGLVITYLLRHNILKVSWTIKDDTKKGIITYLKFCIPSVVILGIVFAVYFPGVGSIDTQYIWQIIHENKFTDTHPLMFLMFYKGLSLLWDNIAVITLFQYLMCTLAYGYVAYYFTSKGLKNIWGWAIALALPLLPINAFYTVMLWKDIPYSIGLLVFIVLTIKVFEDNYFDKVFNITKYVSLGLFVMFMRHNGFIPVLGTVGLMGLYFLLKKHFKTMFKIAAVGIALIVLFFGIKTGVANILISQSNKNDSTESTEAENTVSYDNKTIMFFVFPRTIATQQLIYIENYSGDYFTQQQKEDFAKFLIPEKVEEHKFEYRIGNKYGPNWEFYHKPYLTQRSVPRDMLPEFWDYYFEICLQHPVTAFESYQKIVGITWASVGYGPTALRGYSGDRFTEYVGDKYYEFMAPIKKTLNNTVFSLYKGSLILLCRPAFYLMIILIFCLVGYKRHKWKYIISMSPVFLNILGYLLVIAAQDVRYFFINMSAFIVAIAYATMKKENAKETALDEK